MTDIVTPLGAGYDGDAGRVEEQQLLTAAHDGETQSAPHCTCLCGIVASWERVVVLTLSISYGVTMNLVRNAFYTSESEMKASVLGDSGFELVLAGGYATYAIGKLLFGVFADSVGVGGKTLFVYSLAGSGLCSIGMAFCNDETACAIVWALSRLVQPAGFIGLIMLFSKWVPYHRMGRSVGAQSLIIYSLDAVTRALLGRLRAWLGWNWRTISAFAGGMALLSCLPCIFLVHASPTALGLPAVAANPHTASVAHADGADKRTRGARAVLAPLLASTTFWLTCTASLLMTTMREVFNTLDTDLLQRSGASAAAAASASSVFPLCGVPACVLCGWLIDAFDRRRNGEVFAFFSTGLLVCCVAFHQLPLYAGAVESADDDAATNPASAHGYHDFTTAVVLLGMSGFFLIGPYSLCAGVLAADIGGCGSAGTASSLIDFAGYIGSIGAMLVCGRLGSAYGSVFVMMISLAALTVALGGCFMCYQRRKRSGSPAEERQVPG